MRFCEAVAKAKSNLGKDQIFVLGLRMRFGVAAAKANRLVEIFVVFVIVVVNIKVIVIPNVIRRLLFLKLSPNPLI